jgi:RNA recognition motif-containing protein
MTIYVGNLSYDVTEDDVKEVFAEYGEVTRVSLPREADADRIRGFGFVDLKSSENEDSAIEELDGAEWMGRTLRVNKARPRNANKRWDDRSS